MTRGQTSQDREGESVEKSEISSMVVGSGIEISNNGGLSQVAVSGTGVLEMDLIEL